MIFELIRLQILKGLRSSSLSRNIVGGFFLSVIIFLILASLLILAIALKDILQQSADGATIIAILNGHLLFFFLAEMLYRFMLQQQPVVEIEHYLHLPIKQSQVIHFLLGKSFLSPLSIVALICFTPITIMHIAPQYGWAAATQWLCAIVLISWTIHWMVLWFKQQFRNNWTATVIFFLITFSAFAANYFDLFNVGTLAAPFFGWTLESPWPVLFCLAALCLIYYGTYQHYRRHMYLEELGTKRDIQFLNRSVSFFSKFGLAGEIADLEWKLILRHKKSRTYLILSFLLLLYGLMFYGDQSFATDQGFSSFYIFMGVFITGAFLMQYGTYFLSWNSGSLDFYLARQNGLRALIKGKYLLFFVISLICFVLSIPYVYFGWDILLIHIACFLFNMGISIHIVIYFALWKPKPMDLSKSAFFNYEGAGVAQFLMGIPLILFPYLIFLPAAYVINDYFGLAVLATAGIIGIIFYEQLSDICVRRLERQKHIISSTFRQEL